MTLFNLFGAHIHFQCVYSHCKFLDALRNIIIGIFSSPSGKKMMQTCTYIELRNGNYASLEYNSPSLLSSPSLYSPCFCLSIPLPLSLSLSLLFLLLNHYRNRFFFFLFQPMIGHRIRCTRFNFGKLYCILCQSFFRVKGDSFIST